MSGGTQLCTGQLQMLDQPLLGALNKVLVLKCLPIYPISVKLCLYLVLQVSRIRSQLTNADSSLDLIQKCERLQRSDLKSWCETINFSKCFFQLAAATQNRESVSWNKTNKENFSGAGLDPGQACPSQISKPTVLQRSWHRTLDFGCSTLSSNKFPSEFFA